MHPLPESPVRPGHGGVPDRHPGAVVAHLRCDPDRPDLFGQNHPQLRHLPLTSLEDSINEGIDSGGSRRDAVTEVDNYTRIIRISPTTAQIKESGFGQINDDGIAELPNDTLMYRPADKVDGATIQDANLLKIRVQYCYKLMVPLVNRIIGSLSELNNQRTNQEVYETPNDPRFADANRYYVNASSGITADYETLCGNR
ncbi:MAG: hypothetical protein P8171_23495, partial [Candidatus Thiodiazotropha sp.]